MERQQVITVLDSLANGIDPATGTRIPHDTFHDGDVVRALFAASKLLRSDTARPVASREPTHQQRTTFSSAGLAWTPEEDARLAQEFDAGMTVAQIALQHRRTSGAITSRLVKIGRLSADAAKARPEAKPRLVS